MKLSLVAIYVYIENIYWKWSLVAINVYIEN